MRVLFRHFSNFFRRKMIRQMSSGPKIFIRREEGAEQFQVSFQFVHEHLNIQRPCNFNRSVYEPVDVFLSRVKTNVEKVFLKKARKKMKTVSEPVDDKVVVTLTSDGQNVDKTKRCLEFFFETPPPQNLIMSITGTDYSVSINSPWILKIEMPKIALSGFPLYPSKVKIFNGDVKNSKFTWEKSSNNGQTWTPVGETFVFIPTNSDVSHMVKVVCVPGNGEYWGPYAEAILPRQIEPGPEVCYRLGYTHFAPFGNFRVVSYNILSDLYAETDVAKHELFVHCPPYALTLDYRKPLYIQEIINYRADVICLQEVDVKVFEYDLTYMLGCLHYGGAMAKKSGRTSEGVATFFNRLKFRCVKDQSITFAEEIDKEPIFAEIWKQVQSNSSLLQRFKVCSQVVQAVILESLENPDNYVIVGNTHLYFHPDSDHIRLLQAGMALKWLWKIVRTYEEVGKKVSLVFCGDFNSTPDSGIYKLMTENFIPTDYKDWNSNTEEKVSGLQLSHSLKIKSACGTPKFTNYTAEFCACLDYIFYTTKWLSVTNLLPLPHDEILEAYKGLPSVSFPSDHLALVADFKWE